MKFEDIRNIEAKHLRASNMMQVELVNRMFGYEMAHEKFGEWAKEYSSEFRLVLDKLVDENPNILDEWEVEANQDEILKRIETELYRKDQEIEMVA